jgi:hypothetical protein
MNCVGKAAVAGAAKGTKALFLEAAGDTKDDGATADGGRAAAAVVSQISQPSIFPTHILE